MSYARPLETGHYIWSDGETMDFDSIKVDEESVNVFLYKLYKTRNKEFKERLKLGKQAIDNYKKEYLGD